MKNKYISPQSTSVQFTPAHMLADSNRIPTTNNDNVDNSDKSAAREWMDESFVDE